MFDFDHVVITPWKLIGYSGTLLCHRALVRAGLGDQAKRRTHLPMAFWWPSIVGSLLTLSYFIWARTIRSASCRTLSGVRRGLQHHRRAAAPQERGRRRRSGRRRWLSAFV